VLLGFGNSAKPGLSAGVDAGYDFTENALQYYGVQTSYNWNCCGVSVEYRRLALGSLRNEGEPIFGFTLSGIGMAGNLKHAEQIF
jgi:LPS-assembly protein